LPAVNAPLLLLVTPLGCQARRRPAVHRPQFLDTGTTQSTRSGSPRRVRKKASRVLPPRSRDRKVLSLSI